MDAGNPVIGFGTALTADPVEASATAPAPAEPAPAAEPVEAAEPEVPEGAGVTATERDGKPMLTVYFDSGSSDVSPDFGATASEVLAFLEAGSVALMQHGIAPAPDDLFALGLEGPFVRLIDRHDVEIVIDDP